MVDVVDAILSQLATIVLPVKIPYLESALLMDNGLVVLLGNTFNPD
jgi:hypothetical protein